MTSHLQRFAIYSKDPKVPFPLAEISIKRDAIIAGIKAGTFPLAEVSSLFKRAAEAIQDAIQQGKTNESEKSDGDKASPGEGAKEAGGQVEPSGDRKTRKGKAPAHK